MLKGYRMFMYGFAVVFLGLLGKHLPPEVIYQWIDVILGTIGAGIIFLRLITSTPFGQKLEHMLLSDDAVLDLSNLTASLDPGSTATLTTAVGDLNSAVSTLTGHPLLQPEAATALRQLVDNLALWAQTPYPPVDSVPTAVITAADAPPTLSSPPPIPSQPPQDQQVNRGDPAIAIQAAQAQQ